MDEDDYDYFEDCDCDDCRRERGEIKPVENNYDIDPERWAYIRNSVRIESMPNCCAVKLLTRLGGSDNSVDGYSNLSLTNEEFKALMKERRIKEYCDESQLFTFITTEQKVAAERLKEYGFKLVSEYDNPKHRFETRVQLWSVDVPVLIKYVYGEEEKVTRRFGV